MNPQLARKYVVLFVLSLSIGCNNWKPQLEKPTSKTALKPVEYSLNWRPFTKDNFKQLGKSKNPCLIYLHENHGFLTAHPKFYVEHNLDKSPNIEFQRFIKRNHVELFEFEYSWNQPEKDYGLGEELALDFDDLFRKQEPDFDPVELLTPTFVLTLPESPKFYCFWEFVEASDIMAAVLSSGSNMNGREYQFNEIAKPK